LPFKEDCLRYLLIAIGGALGSTARFWVGSTVNARFGSKFPCGTLAINISACVLLGLSLTVLERRSALDPGWRFFLPFGFVGAYSTFSTFQWELFSSMEERTFILAGANLSLSVVLGFAAVWCGARLGRAFF
jgi:fluoride exporter